MPPTIIIHLFVSSKNKQISGFRNTDKINKVCVSHVHAIFRNDDTLRLTRRKLFYFSRIEIFPPLIAYLHLFEMCFLSSETAKQGDFCVDQNVIYVLMILNNITWIAE